MKKAVVLVVLLFFSMQHMFGQSTYAPDPVIGLGNIPATYNNGKSAMPGLSSEEILANPRLTSNNPACEVVQYTVSVLPYKQEFLGPYVVKGPEFTQQVKDIIKNNSGRKGVLYIEEIRVRYEDRDRAYSPIILKYGF